MTEFTTYLKEKVIMESVLCNSHIVDRIVYLYLQSNTCMSI